MRPPIRLLLALAPFLLLARPAAAANPLVRVTTPLGSFDIELCEHASALCPGAAPNTVANFLGYVDAGTYDETFVHRSVFGFVIQGGSWYLGSDAMGNPLVMAVDTGDPVASEFTGVSNVRGTVAVPLLSDPPGSGNPCDTNEDSGTSGWFVSVGDNSNLDCGLFTVFGVVDADGMVVVDAINDLVTYNAGAGFGQLPLLDTYPCCTTPVRDYLVYTDVQRVPEPATPLAGCLAGAVLAAHARRRRARRVEAGPRAEELPWEATA